LNNISEAIKGLKALEEMRKIKIEVLEKPKKWTRNFLTLPIFSNPKKHSEGWEQKEGKSQSYSNSNWSQRWTRYLDRRV